MGREGFLFLVLLKAVFLAFLKGVLGMMMIYFVFSRLLEQIQVLVGKEVFVLNC